MLGGLGRSTRIRAMFSLLILTVLMALLVAASVGTARIGPSTVAAIALKKMGFVITPWWDDAAEVIILQVRLPRVVLALLVGMSLAACGAAFQGLFRNPMADPFVLGVSPGAALGATIAIVLRVNVSVMGISSIPLFAFAGGLATAIAVYTISWSRGTVRVESLLLTGIAVGSLLSSLTSLLMVLSQHDLHQAFFWIMGGLSARTWSHVTMVLPYAVLGLSVLLGSARELNLMLLGEEDAFHLGVEVERAKARILLAAALSAAAAVAAAGIVGFVGLMVPHIVRIMTGPDHRVFLPATVLAGGATLVGADVLARMILPPEEIPLGLVTALMGAPFFLYLLRRKVSER